MQPERVNNISIEEFMRDYCLPERPVIVSGALEHWPACEKWSLDYFVKNYADKPVFFSDKQWTMGEFIDMLRSGIKPAPYLNQVKLDSQFPELKTDIGDLKYTLDNRLESRLLPSSMRIEKGIKSVFIGGKGSGFGKLHWDFSYLHVFISQVRGDKDFLIFSPEDSPYLYPRPDVETTSLIKDINDFNEDEYPLYKKATPIRFTAREGDTVFLPGGWWHSTKMNCTSISIAESSLNLSNWKLRYEWVLKCYKQQGVPLFKRMALKSYMRAIGHLF